MVHISRHAKLRYRQRADAREQSPEETMRELYEEADTQHRHPQVEEGVAAVVDDLVLVIRDDTIATVLRRSPA